MRLHQGPHHVEADAHAGAPGFGIAAFDTGEGAEDRRELIGRDPDAVVAGLQFDVLGAARDRKLDGNGCWRPG